MINCVHIARRFQRSVRIDTDIGDAKALDGFVCPASYANVLREMSVHISQARQGAFTWTGPYGSGKSSLAVALSVALGGSTDEQKQANKIFGRQLAEQVKKSMPTGTKGWRVVPVVGRRGNAINAIGDAIKQNGLITHAPRGGWNEQSVMNALQQSAADRPKSHGGVFLFIDEMGKFLESAVQDDADIYIFQQLAEMASRSNGRFILVGILHQSFDEYASRASRDMRQEWAKIQGRFIDLAVSTTREEQIDILSRAIENNRKTNAPDKHAQVVAKCIHRRQPGDIRQLASTLESCWPLHAVVTCLLGPISRRRFGQNQRSVFGFLSSFEPHGFQDFLQTATEQHTYDPARLWDYLRANLEASILASPDAHRWALATEAIDRCQSRGGDALHINLLKTIAILDLCRERSGLAANLDILHICFSDKSLSAIEKALSQLNRWSLIIYKKFIDSYTVFAGSDFNIEQALSEALANMDQVDFFILQELIKLPPILAKRHYHETGTMRWFKVNYARASEIAEIASAYQPDNGVIGQFLLAIPDKDDSDEHLKKLCRKVTRCERQPDIIIGVSEHARDIEELSRELVALDIVRNNHPQLAGDAVARHEVNSRIATVQTQVEAKMRTAFDDARWFYKGLSPKSYRYAELNVFASELASEKFSQCPKVHNELLNRHKPSGSANSALKALLRRMLANEGEARLGIVGFPAEGGLFVSLLESTHLYQQEGEAWKFVTPKNDEEDYRFAPLWEATARHLKKHSKQLVSVTDLYEKVWQQPPFGIKRGLASLLATTFILTQRKNISIYRDGLFRVRFDDLDVDYLVRDLSTIQLRWMKLSETATRILFGMSEIIRTFDQSKTIGNAEPIDVARALVALYDELPAWTKRTARLSNNASRIRELFKRANDPNKFLFDDIPGIFGYEILSNENDVQHVVCGIRDGLEELMLAYPSMLRRIRELMMEELRVHNMSVQSLADLHARANNIKQLAGDFHLEAFVGRLAQLDDSDSAFEGIASLAAGKPPRDWVDPDIDRASLNIAEMAQKFIRAETFAHIKGRPDKRQVMGVVVGMDGRPAPLHEFFDVADTDSDAIDGLVRAFASAIESADQKHRNIILASLAKISAHYIEDASDDEQPKKSKGGDRCLTKKNMS